MPSQDIKLCLQDPITQFLEKRVNPYMLLSNLQRTGKAPPEYTCSGYFCHLLGRGRVQRGGEAVFPTVLTTYWRSLDWKEAHLTLSVAVLGMSVGVGEGSNGQDLAFDGHPQQDNSGQGAA